MNTPRFPNPFKKQPFDLVTEMVRSPYDALQRLRKLRKDNGDAFYTTYIEQLLDIWLRESRYAMFVFDFDGTLTKRHALVAADDSSDPDELFVDWRFFKLFVATACKYDKAVGIASKNTISVILSYLKLIGLDDYFKNGRIVTTDEVVARSDDTDRFAHVKDYMIKLLCVFTAPVVQKGANEAPRRIMLYEDDMTAVIQSKLADGLWTPEGFTYEVWLGQAFSLFEKCPVFEKMTGREEKVPCVMRH